MNLYRLYSQKAIKNKTATKKCAECKTDGESVKKYQTVNGIPSEWDKRIKWKHSVVLDSDSNFLYKTDHKTNTANNTIIHWHIVIARNVIGI